MKILKKRRIPKGLKVFLCVVFIVYLISGLIVGYSTLKSGEPFHGWLYYWDGHYKGKVVDLDTRDPIEGAVVAGRWYLEVMVGWPRFCDAVETTTDIKGEFTLPRAWCISPWPLARLSLPGDVVVFKPGYLGYPPLGYNQEERRAYMPSFTGDEFTDENQYNLIELGRPKTRQEREFTSDHAHSPLDFDDTYKRLPTLLRFINEDRKALGFRGEIGPPEKGGYR